MIGYTSVGARCSIVPVRFNCPPEITLPWPVSGQIARVNRVIADVPAEQQSRKKHFAHEEDDHD